MATSTIPHAAPAAHRRRKPDPARVVQSYYAQVQALGKRGAYRRTGDLYGISDETVRRYVLAHEGHAMPAATIDPLAYVPPPGGYPELPLTPRIATDDITQPQEVPQPAEAATCGNVADGDPLLAELERAIMSNVHFCGNATEDATRHTAERNDVADEVPESPQEPGIDLDPHDPTWRSSPTSPTHAPDEPVQDSTPKPGPEPPPPPGTDPGELFPPDPHLPARVPTVEPEHATPDSESKHAAGVVAASARSPRVVRQVVRVPVERQAGGLVGWLQAHEAARMQLIALVAVLLLIAATWLG